MKTAEVLSKSSGDLSMKPTSRIDWKEVGQTMAVLAFDLCLWVLLTQLLAQNTIPEESKSGEWGNPLEWLIRALPAIAVGMFPAMIQMLYKPVLVFFCLGANKEPAARILALSFLVSCVLNVLFIVYIVFAI